MGCTLVILVALLVVGPSLSLGTSHELLERALGRTPEAEIARYLAAVAEADRQAALALWRPAWADQEELQLRREAVTDALIAYGPGLTHEVVSITWWRTCCEPAIIDDAGQAGGAHVTVSVSSGLEAERLYLFDLLVPAGYWGRAAGDPLRDWELVDVYPQEASPLVWPMTE
jgi:hypothetical protein